MVLTAWALEDNEDDDVNDDDESIDEQQDFLNKDLNPPNLPNIGDQVIFWDPDLQCSVKATITPMDRKLQLEWPGWRNIRVHGARRQTCVNMDIVSPNCVSCRFLQDVPQVDGNYTEDNATNSTPSTQNVSSHLFQNISVTFDALNLAIPESGEISPNRVYRLPSLPPDRPRSQPPVNRNRTVPKFLKKLNPFKKK
jgi:hypothetical protein